MYWISIFFAFFLGSVLGMIFMCNKFIPKIDQQENILSVCRKRNNIFYNLLQHKGNNYDLGLELKKKGYNRVAIYGMGVIGKLLYDELEKTDIQVIIGIDQKPIVYKNLDVMPLQKSVKFEGIDVIINTVIDGDIEVEKSIYEIYSGPVISIMEIL